MNLVLSPPWRDRHGRFVPLKAAVFACAFVPALVIGTEWACGWLGPRSLNEAIHGFGLWTIRFLLIALAVSPAQAAFHWPQLILVRRMLGVTAMSYGLAHLSLYIIDQNLDLAHVASEIWNRIYLTIGFIALLGLVALGVTSTNGWMRRLGKNWKRLHRLVYGIAVLALLHYFMQSKANVSEPAVAAGLFAWLMVWRRLPARSHNQPSILLGLAFLSAATTALIEAAWYGLATRVSAMRILEANLTTTFGVRPSAWVALITIVIAGAILGWRAARPPRAVHAPARRPARQPARQPSA